MIILHVQIVAAKYKQFSGKIDSELKINFYNNEGSFNMSDTPSSGSSDSSDDQLLAPETVVSLSVGLVKALAKKSSGE